MMNFWERVVAELIFKVGLALLGRVAKTDFALDVSHALQERVLRRGWWSGVGATLHALATAVNDQTSPYRDALLWQTAFCGWGILIPTMLSHLIDGMHLGHQEIWHGLAQFVGMMSGWSFAAFLFRGVGCARDRGFAVGFASYALITLCALPVLLVLVPPLFYGPTQSRVFDATVIVGMVAWIPWGALLALNRPSLMREAWIEHFFSQFEV
jgi:hypothetical protein